MGNRKIIIALVSISVALVCCKATQSLTPTDSDVTAAQSHWTGTTLTELQKGYDIYADACTNCHEMKKPQDFTVKEWDNILPGMSKKAHLDSNQYRVVYHYILAKRETILASKK